MTAIERRRANEGIDCLLGRFRGSRIIDLLQVIKHKVITRDLSPIVLTVALERVERQHYEPGSKDAIFLAGFKASLEESK